MKENNWREEAELEWQNHLAAYYLKNKDKAFALRSPSTHETVEWWCNKLASVREETEREVLVRVGDCLISGKKIEDEFPNYFEKE